MPASARLCVCVHCMYYVFAARRVLRQRGIACEASTCMCVRGRALTLYLTPEMKGKTHTVYTDPSSLLLLSFIHSLIPFSLHLFLHLSFFLLCSISFLLCSIYLFYSLTVAWPSPFIAVPSVFLSSCSSSCSSPPLCCERHLPSLEPFALCALFALPCVLQTGLVTFPAHIPRSYPHLPPRPQNPASPVPPDMTVTVPHYLKGTECTKTWHRRHGFIPSQPKTNRYGKLKDTYE